MLKLRLTSFYIIVHAKKCLLGNGADLGHCDCGVPICLFNKSLTSYFSTEFQMDIMFSRLTSFNTKISQSNSVLRDTALSDSNENMCGFFLCF